MKNLIAVLACCFFLFAGAVWAQAPTVGGAPVTSGQTIAASGTPVVINLPDGSTFTVEANSSVVMTLDATSGKWKCNLLSGRVSWNLTALSSALVSVQGRSLNMNDKQGYAEVANRKRGGGAMAGGAGAAAAGTAVGLSSTTVAIIVGATLGATGLGVGLYEGLKSSSPK